MDVRTCTESDKFQVSSCGMIWRVKNQSLYRLSPYKNRGVLYVDLYMDGGQKRLAELVLKAFGIDGKGHIEYIDGNKSNCDISNLKWKE